MGIQGQMRKVHIYRMVVENTVEEKFLSMRESKEASTQSVAGSLANDKEKLRYEEYLDLFS